MNFFKRSNSGDSGRRQRREGTGRGGRPQRREGTGRGGHPQRREGMGRGGRPQLPSMFSMEYEMQAYRERLVLLRSANRDIVLDLPPAVPMPEAMRNLHKGCTSKGTRFHNAEQESESLCPITPNPSANRDLVLDPPPAVPMPEGMRNLHKGCTSKGTRFHNAEQESELLCPITPPNVTIYNRDPIPHVVRITRRPSIFDRILMFLGIKKIQEPEEEVIVPRIPCPPLHVMVPVRPQNVSEKSKQGSNLESVPTNQNAIPATTPSNDVQPSLDSSAEKESH